MSIFDSYRIYGFAYAISLIYLFIKRKELRFGRELFWLNALLLIVVSNPLFKRFITDTMLNGYAWRTFWLLPLWFTLAYVLICSFNEHWKAKRFLIIPYLIFVLAITGGFAFTSDNYTLATNPYKLPQDCIDVCDYLLENNSSQIKIVAPKSLYSHVRQYTSRIDLLYGRNIEGYMNGVFDQNLLRVNEIMKKKKLKAAYFEELHSILSQYGCNYIVFDTTSRHFPADTDLSSIGFTNMTTINERYRIYKVD